MNPEELAYWYWLTDVRGIGPIISKKLVDEFGTPTQVFSTAKSEIVLRTGIRDSLADNIDHSKNNIERYVRLAENQIRVAEIVNGHILTCADSPYSEFYKNHNGDRALPAVIHAIGNIGCLSEHTFAVVGTRSASEDAKKEAYELAHNLATAGFPVASGLALGIDTMAHRGALEAGGSTIAVLGCGADVKYPLENATLYNSIVEKGLIISEFPFGTRPTSENLRKRNRTIIAISQAVVVVQCSLQSGAMIAARFATQQKKPIFTFRYGEMTDNSGGDWLISKSLAVKLENPSVDGFLHALNSYQGTEANVDRIFSEIWPKKPRKEKSAMKTDKSKKPDRRVTAAPAESSGQAQRSEVLQSRMVLGGSVGQQTSANQVNEAFHFKLGDSVSHPTFGKGEIVNIVRIGSDYQVTVRFSEKKLRTLSWQYANLTKL
jgi:DNA processing protein